MNPETVVQGAIARDHQPSSMEFSEQEKVESRISEERGRPGKAAHAEGRLMRGLRGLCRMIGMKLVRLPGKHKRGECLKCGKTISRRYNGELFRHKCLTELQLKLKWDAEHGAAEVPQADPTGTAA